jgi:hypothetical protein
MIIRSRIEGEFNGTENETIFNLQNGQVWQQVGYRYRYHYLYAPRVEIDASGSRGTMTVAGFREPIEVRRVA